MKLENVKIEYSICNVEYTKRDSGIYIPVKTSVEVEEKRDIEQG